ncbi:MAG: hypothetical protein ACFFG0_03530 [Candidatus Thorarchaeota archaeon]
MSIPTEAKQKPKKYCPTNKFNCGFCPIVPCEHKGWNDAIEATEDYERTKLYKINS